jgi:hypothetical protein
MIDLLSRDAASRRKLSGVGNSSSNPSIWMNSTILDGEALKILTM